MYRYETHLHTWPVSRCAKSDVRETLEFYKRMDYAGVFVTNHFLDGNINIDHTLPYDARLNFYFSDYYKALEIGDELGIQVLLGIEMSYKGTDFLVYGLDDVWYFTHPELAHMRKSEQLPFLMEHGALIIHAHPFREAAYIDHIRLFPRQVHGVEVYNANRTAFENHLAEVYAREYGLLTFAGSDNHWAGNAQSLGGMCFDTPLMDERDFTARILRGEGKQFRLNLEDMK